MSPAIATTSGVYDQDLNSVVIPEYPGEEFYFLAGK